MHVLFAFALFRLMLGVKGCKVKEVSKLKEHMNPKRRKNKNQMLFWIVCTHLCTLVHARAQARTGV